MWWCIRGGNPVRSGIKRRVQERQGRGAGRRDVVGYVVNTQGAGVADRIWPARVSVVTVAGNVMDNTLQDVSYRCLGKPLHMRGLVVVVGWSSCFKETEERGHLAQLVIEGFCQ